MRPQLDDERRQTKLPFTGAFEVQFDPDQPLADRELDSAKSASTHKASQHKIHTHRQTALEKTRSGRSTPIEVRAGSPWHMYQERYRQRLGENLAVGQLAMLEGREDTDDREEDRWTKLYAIRKLEAADVHGKVQMLQRIRHENFIHISQIFLEGSTCYTVSDLDEISLYDFCKPKFNLSDVQVAAVVCQILRGIEFLTLQNLRLNDLSCSNVVVSRQGTVKIVNAQDCTNRSFAGGKRITSETLQLQGVTLTMMEKSAPSDLPSRLSQPERWPNQVVEFVNSIPYRTPLDLLQDRFLRDAPNRSELAWMVSLTKLATHIRYEYK